MTRPERILHLKSLHARWLFELQVTYTNDPEHADSFAEALADLERIIGELESNSALEDTADDDHLQRLSDVVLRDGGFH